MEPQLPRKYYMNCPLIPRLIWEYADPHITELMKKYKARIESNNGEGGITMGGYDRAGDKDEVMRHFWDGNVFQRYFKQHQMLSSDPRSIALQLNIHGIPLV